MLRSQAPVSNQGEIWREIEQKSETLGTRSATFAMADLYQAHEPQLSGYLEALEVVPGQVGALFGLDHQVGLELFDQRRTLSQPSSPKCFEGTPSTRLSRAAGLSPASC